MSNNTTARREAARRYKATPKGREKNRFFSKRWRDANKLKLRMRDWRLKKYGITQGDYETMLVKQDGRCAICGRVDNYGKRNLAIDHCHQSGKVRGLLCNPCNAGIGSFMDDPKLLNAAIKYLEVIEYAVHLV